MKRSMSTSVGTVVGTVVAPSRAIVTPEAVVLDLEVAGIASRALARAIDAALQGAALVALVALAAALSTVSELVGVVVALSGVAGVLFGYPALFEWRWRGRTPGKAVLGLRVHTVEGAPVRAVHAFTRSVLQLVDLYLPPGGLLAVLSALFTARNQRLGDLVAGTVVLRERSAAGQPRAVTFVPPSGWEAYTASLDTSRLRDEQYQLVRSLLVRVGELEPGARWHLAQRIAGPIAQRLGHTPPPGVHPEAFLLCVAAAHQRRQGLASAPPAAPPPPPPSGPPPPAPSGPPPPPPPPPPSPASPPPPPPPSPPSSGPAAPPPPPPPPSSGPAAPPPPPPPPPSPASPSPPPWVPQAP
jgi:uncharacterized RDD family membrane protein YckC